MGVKRSPLPTEHPLSDFELVETTDQLDRAVDALARSTRVAVDLESNGFFRYRERICLVQLASPDAVYLVDPLAVGDAGPLGDLMADPSVEKIFHAPGYDIRSLDRDWGFGVRNLFDTSLAAAFAGSERLGLQAVLEEYVGVKLPKSRRLQRSDWTLRPLSDEALNYAASDVLHLARLRDALAERLHGLGRTRWLREECERMEQVRHSEPDREAAFLSVKGSRALDGRGLAVLRSLCRLRDELACELDRPPFKVMSDAALVAVSVDPGVNLGEVKGLGRYGRRPDVRKLRSAIQEGMDADPVRRPRKAHVRERLSPSERRDSGERMKRLKQWRRSLGEDLAVDPSILWPNASLTRLARSPDSLAAELDSDEVRKWQGREFAASLRGLLSSLC